MVPFRDSTLGPPGNGLFAEQDELVDLLVGIHFRNQRAHVVGQLPAHVRCPREKAVLLSQPLRRFERVRSVFDRSVPQTLAMQRGRSAFERPNRSRKVFARGHHDTAACRLGEPSLGTSVTLLGKSPRPSVLRTTVEAPPSPRASTNRATPASLAFFNAVTTGGPASSESRGRRLISAESAEAQRNSTDPPDYPPCSRHPHRRS